MKPIYELQDLRHLCGVDMTRAKDLPVDVGDYPIAAGERMVFRPDETNSNYTVHGKSAVNIINACLALIYRRPEDVKTILDFPCGHGRLTRSLKKSYPNADLYASDLDEDGVDFCAATFGAHGVYSKVDVSELEFPAKFDVIFVGSLYSHLPEDQWDSFTKMLQQSLNPGGIVVITFEGVFVAELLASGELGGVTEEAAAAALESYRARGFGYAPYPALKGVLSTDESEYGRTLVTPTWVRRYFDRFPQLRTVLHGERMWTGRQDVICLQLEPALAKAREAAPKN